MTTTAHPSFLELDRAALGVDIAAPARAHLDACARCRQHVEAMRRSEPPPAWVRHLAPARAPRRAWLWGGGLALATACAVLLLVARRSAPDDAARFTTVKGAPTVLLHVKRGETVATWDGRATVAPGDRLRLEVAPAGYRRIRVLGARGAVLHDAPLGAVAALLPVAWQVDDQPGPETLTIFLTDHPVDRAWRTTLTLPKDLDR